jgi:hypothetical protein
MDRAHSTVQPEPRVSAADGVTVPVAIEEESVTGAAETKAVPPGRRTEYVPPVGATSAPPAP